MSRPLLPIGPRALSGSWVAYLVVTLASTAGYFALPRGGVGQAFVLLGINLAAVGAILAGVRIWRPSKPGVWYLLALAQLVYLAAYAVWYLYPVALHGVLPFPSIADALFIAAYLGSGAALLLLVRGRAIGGQNRADLLDATIIALGLASISWVFLIGPNLASTALDLPSRLVSVAYPLLDIAMLALAIRLAVTPGARATSHWLLLLWIGGQFAADFAYAVTLLNGTFSFGAPLFAGWMLSFAFLGTAALHPSMRALARPTAADSNHPEITGRRRLIPLAGASLIPIALIMFDTRNAQPENRVVLAAVAGVLFLLVTLRISGLMVNVAEHRRVQLELEREIILDPLTALVNRRGLAMVCEHHFELANRHKKPLTLLFIDIDRMKGINDSFGHPEGDRALMDTARVLAMTFRKSDVLARLGGDEFCVLMTESTGEGPDVAIARLQEKVKAFNADRGRQYTLSLSVGAARYDPAAPASLDALLEQADRAMYRQKRRPAA